MFVVVGLSARTWNGTLNKKGVGTHTSFRLFGISCRLMAGVVR